MWRRWPGVLVDLPPPSVVPRADSGGDSGGDSGAGTSTEVRPASHSNRAAAVRQPIGFLTSGGYSWERGRPNGVGFASVAVRLTRTLSLAHSFSHTSLKSPCAEQGLRELFSKDLLVGLCHTPPTAAVRSVPTARAREGGREREFSGPRAHGRLQLELTALWVVAVVVLAVCRRGRVILWSCRRRWCSSATLNRYGFGQRL